MERQSSGKGSLIGITAVIWAFATAMLGICIPLVSITQSGLVLPLTVILVTGFVTTVLWLTPVEQVQRISELTKTMELLEQRVTDLETIDLEDELEPPPKLETEAEYS